MKPPPRPDTNGQRDIHWVDVNSLLFSCEQWLTGAPQGLRGVASVLVVTSHLARAFTPSLLSPANGDQEAPSYAQLPILRLAAQGPPWVALFFLLTGYVNAIKPIKQARNGSIDFALADLASSCFRRTGRLVLPATIATILSWVICELGGYKHGRISDATWIRDTSPDPSKSVSEAVRNLWYNLFTTWSKGANKYDAIQWTLPFLLKGSMLVYMALLATIRTLPIYRLSILLGLFFFSWASRDSLTGMNVFAGAFLAELNSTPFMKNASNSRFVSRTFPPFLILLGLYVCGYPEQHPEWSAWSANLRRTGNHMFPSGTEFWRYWPTVGIQNISIGIILSPDLQKLLSRPRLLWLGRLSFPLYLLHGPLLRSILSWMLFGFEKRVTWGNQDAEGHFTPAYDRLPLPPLWRFILALPIYWAILLTFSNLWVAHVEPRCALMVKRMEEVMMRRNFTKLPP